MNKYLIALSVGGIMEMPDITYQDLDKYCIFGYLQQ